MADILGSITDLRTLLGVDATELPDGEATLLLELATGEVQAAAGQELVQRTGDTVTLVGTTDGWLDLPQRPVQSVTTVKIDGSAITDYSRFGARLWREAGWSAGPYTPTPVEVTYDHGYADTDPQLQLARSVALAAAVYMYTDPTGKATGFSIDDYREQYAGTSGSDSGVVTAGVRKSLRRQYGPRGRLSRVG